MLMIRAIKELVMLRLFTIKDKSLKSGLLLIDISIHLPVFVIYDHGYVKCKDAHQIMYGTVRTEEAMNTFRDVILTKI